jgi:hypothetical protein
MVNYANVEVLSSKFRFFMRSVVLGLLVTLYLPHVFNECALLLKKKAAGFHATWWSFVFAEREQTELPMSLICGIRVCELTGILYLKRIPRLIA